MSQNLSKSHFLNCESSAIDTNERVAFLSFAVNGSMDHGLPHSFWQWHGPQTSTQSSMAVKTTDINTTLCHSMRYRHHHSPASSTGQGHQHSRRCQHGPWTSTQPQIAAQTMDHHITTAPQHHNRIIDLDLAISSGNPMDTVGFQTWDELLRCTVNIPKWTWPPSSPGIPQSLPVTGQG